MAFFKSMAMSTAALALSAGMASAAVVSFVNVTVSPHDPAEYQTIYNDFLPGLGRIVEDFAGPATPGRQTSSDDKPTHNPDAQINTTYSSDVGTFAAISGTGSGWSVTGNGSKLQIRSGDNAGRFNVLDPGANFLDSNDTRGFTWTIQNTDGLLRGMSAFITDPNDASRQLTVKLLDGAGNSGFEQTITGSPGNSSVWHLTADFTGVEWSTAVFEFKKNNVGDGFAISNATLHVIPLPAPAFLLLGGMGVFGGMAALRRRRQKASA